MTKTCPHAASGCDYPASECAGHCASKQQPEALRLADLIDANLAEEMTGEILYRKVGRRYVPAYNVHSAYDKDAMAVGTWRMVYAYEANGRRYHYDVKPDTASFEAACMLARDAMERAISDAAQARPQLGKVPYTKSQLALIKEYRQRMAEAGIAFPPWWQHSGPHEITQAAIDAVKNWREA